MDKLELPWWMSADELEKLRAAAQSFWAKVEYWLNYPVRNIDPLTCDEGVLDLIAWERHIDRFEGEPLALYRRRVKYAFVNARDAGSTIGFKRIFERLGLGYVEIDERTDTRPWDVITLRVSDNQVAGNSRLMGVIVQLYGRTCRRYEWTVLNQAQLATSASEFNERPDHMLRQPDQPK